jgi:hypothetical protein
MNSTTYYVVKSFDKQYWEKHVKWHSVIDQHTTPKSKLQLLVPGNYNVTWPQYVRSFKQQAYAEHYQTQQQNKGYHVVIDIVEEYELDCNLNQTARKYV